ncbi:pirin family protein [Ekhidna sp.]|uniref:pirin family protein n=1 Tax=Ekhidna sp. TaxID=2608089 RepID=UPI0032973458
MKNVIHRANSRGSTNFGWLNSKHTFSFGQYFDPERMNFGMLRVLNDDIVKGGAGFPPHPHSNMEIVSIPLSGALTHNDSTGMEKVINSGEVQIMSAGSGITHSEYNASKTDDVNFLQIWVIPKEDNIKPKYDQKFFRRAERKNTIQPVVSPGKDGGLWINQDAWFSLADLEAQKSIHYTINKEDNGVYVFVIDGEIIIEGETLSKRDAIGIQDITEIEVIARDNSKVLLIEVPMN